MEGKREHCNSPCALQNSAKGAGTTLDGRLRGSIAARGRPLKCQQVIHLAAPVGVSPHSQPFFSA